MPNPEIALRQSMEQVGQQLSWLGGVSRTDLSARRGRVVPEEPQRPIAFAWNGPLADGVRNAYQSCAHQLARHCQRHDF